MLVPSGWDSWGKIKILREGFDCENVSEGWDADMDAVIDRQKPGTTGARGTYEQAIPNGESEIQVKSFFCHSTVVRTVCLNLFLCTRSLNLIYLTQLSAKMSNHFMIAIMKSYKRIKSQSILMLRSTAAIDLALLALSVNLLL